MSNGCPSCGLDLVFSIYFDRFGFQSRADDESMSNIGHLFHQLSFLNGADVTDFLPSKRKTIHYKHYVSGLGTPYRPSDIFESGRELVLDGAIDAAKDAVRGAPKGFSEDVKKEVLGQGKTLKKSVSDVLKRETGMSTQGWKTNWKKLFRHRERARGGNGLTAKQVATSARLARKHAKDALRGAGKYAKTIAKGAAVDALKAGALSVVESTDLSDYKHAAKLFKSGHEKRIQGALDAFETVVKNLKDKIKPRGQTYGGEIRLFVFGAEWGGTMARKFAHRVEDEYEDDGQLMFDDIRIRICFIGLFDCVNGFSAKSAIDTALSYVPLVTISLDDTELSSHVEAALHLYSAYERGYAMPSISQGKAAWQHEWPIPGILADTCGGSFLKGEFGLSNDELAKYSLFQMHAIARSFGAPFAFPDDGTAEAANLDRILAPVLKLNELDIYEAVGLAERSLNPVIGQPKTTIFNYASAYVQWLRMLFDGREDDDDIKVQYDKLASSGNAFLEGLNTQLDHAPVEARRGVQLVRYAMEHKMAQVWNGGDYVDDSFLAAFFATFVHFNHPSLCLTFRDVVDSA